jgi:hypothetical protein
MKRYTIIFLLSVGSIFSACEKKVEDTPIEILRLENQLFTVKSKTELSGLLQKSNVLRNYFSINNSSDSSLVSQLYSNVGNVELQQFNTELQTQFGDLTDIKAQLSEAFQNIKNEYPDFKLPKIATVVSGFLGNDLYLSDSLVVIGLDYFAGPKAKYRPQLYDYQLRRYQREYIVPSIVFFLSEKYNKSNVTDKTLLADMIWYGKGFEFVKHALPQVADSLVVGYSEQQLADVYESQTDIWAYFIERRALYQTQDNEKQRFISERPATVEISQACPGGIGRWLGWRIVNEYLNKNLKTTLKELMENTNAQQILEQSKYRGEKDTER